VAKARKNVEVSGAFIREHVMALLLGAKDTARAIDQEAQQRLLEEDTRLKVHQYTCDISRFLRLIAATGTKLGREGGACGRQSQTGHRMKRPPRTQTSDDVGDNRSEVVDDLMRARRSHWPTSLVVIDQQ
jgi:hypothetical protein